MTTPARYISGQPITGNAPLKPETTQSVAVGAASAATSNAVDAKCSVVRVKYIGGSATDICYIAVGASPTATTSNMPLEDGEVVHLRVEPGTDKVAVIRDGTSAGNIYVTEMI